MKNEKVIKPETFSKSIVVTRQYPVLFSLARYQDYIGWTKFFSYIALQQHHMIPYCNNSRRSKSLNTTDSVMQSLLTSYSERRWIRKIVSEFSISVDLKISIPQSSVLSPLLFILYINFLVYSVDMHSCLYADYTTLCISGDNLSQAIVLTSQGS